MEIDCAQQHSDKDQDARVICQRSRMQWWSARCCRNCFVLSSSCCEAFMRGILSWLLVFLLLRLLLLELLQQLTQSTRSQMHCRLVDATALHVQPQSNPEPANQTASSRRSCCRASFARGRGDSENRHSILQKRRPRVALHFRSRIELGSLSYKREQHQK